MFVGVLATPLQQSWEDSSWGIVKLREEIVLGFPYMGTGDERPIRNKIFKNGCILILLGSFLYIMS